MIAKNLVFVIPGDINTQSGGYGYDRRLIAELRAQGRGVTHLALGASYPNPNRVDAAAAAFRLSELPETCPVIMDGLALGALDSRALDAMAAPLVALIHHPLAFEGGLSDERKAFLHKNEMENLSRAAHVLVTSSHTAQLLESEYGVSKQRITIATPGVDRRICSAAKTDPPLILSVGIQVPRKGHDLLLAALAKITHIPWRAVIAGPVLDETYGKLLAAMITELGLLDRVHLAGLVSAEELANLYCEGSLFALATRYEGYGMVFGEAMAHGLPIVSCLVGAVPETIAEGAGLLVPPEDPESFSRALERVLQEKDLYATLASASKASGETLPSWEETALLFGEVLDGLTSGADHRLIRGSADD